MAHKAPPNILFILADQLTPFALQQYGNKIVKTPNINRLLANKTSIKFNSAYCNSPLCAPSRYSLMTGKLPSNISAYDNASLLPANVPTFAHYLSKLGYHTVTAGKMHFVGPDQVHGFSERLTTDIYPADFGWTANWDQVFKDNNQRYDDWYHNMSSVKHAGYTAITNQFEYDDEVAHVAKHKLYDLARTNSYPWSFFISFTHPHDPYITRKKYWDLYDNVDIDLPIVQQIDLNHPHSQRLANVLDMKNMEITQTDIINARRAYYGNISYIDEKIGELINALIECDTFDNTIIIIAADHGDMLGEHGLWYKMTFGEGSARVPLIMHFPKHLFGSNTGNANLQIDDNVSLIDILPTMIDIGSINNYLKNDYIDDELNGRSLTRYFANMECKHHNTMMQQTDDNIVVGEYFGEGAISPMVMIKYNEYKYIFCLDDPSQIYNLAQDKNELNNVYGLLDDKIYDTLEYLREEYYNDAKLSMLKQKVIRDQHQRRFIYETTKNHANVDWNFHPFAGINYSKDRFMRNHKDLNDLELNSRFPRIPHTDYSRK